ncbi:MAG: methyltransferase domain-containing protein [Anaerolineales bacterium]|nr:methyltransferase domain-containing protein [Anaerolineales bacterium]
MKKIDYDAISKVYDNVRAGDVELIDRLLAELSIDSPCILDIGCGTGNYAGLFKRAGVQIYGVDPSGGMLEQARKKYPNVDFRQGTAGDLPFKDAFFDMVYLTDVIHHVPDIGRMFGEIHRVLAPGGKVCIVTQSHRQIEVRPIARFFPGTVQVDKERYPDIDEIVSAASSHCLACMRQDILFDDHWIEIGQDYLELVRKKGYSMLHLITEREYQSGLKDLENVLQNGPIKVKPAGETLVWLIKE